MISSLLIQLPSAAMIVDELGVDWDALKTDIPR